MKEAIIEERDKVPKEIIDKCIDAFKPRLRYVIELETRHIEQYLLLIIQTFKVTYGMILINQKKLLQFH